MTFSPGAVRGRIRVPGDKSLSHRALIVAATSSQPVEIRNLNPGRDVEATCRALRALGAVITRDGDSATVTGGALRDPAETLDCANSGSTARMIMGVCAGARLRAVFDGDTSLRGRPMEPVAAQLRAFGARVETTGGTLPATVHGAAEVQTRNFILLSPSAQVKSAILFAALFSRTAVTITGDKGSRDHTERLLRYLGAGISFDESHVELRSFPNTLKPIEVAGDFSAAAFFIVAATVARGSSVLIERVGMNSTRTGLLDALRAMGARIDIENTRELCGEHVGDIRVESAELTGASIGPGVALRAIDEILVLAVAAAFARGETRISGVRDLRTKESDRLTAIGELLQSVGIETRVLSDGIVIAGGAPCPNGAVVQTHGDHRTVMAAASLAAGAGPLRIDDGASADVSFPGFAEMLHAAQLAG